MKIGFVGAGKAGCSLGKYFIENGIPVSGYYSKNCKSTAFAATFTNTVHFKELEEIITKSDILFITTPDGSIRDIWEQIKHLLPIKNKILCHCSGYLSSDVFSEIDKFGAYGCSVHPILAMNSKQEAYIHLKNAFFTVEGNDYAVEVMMDLLKKLNNSARVISAQSKAKYHTATSIASNSVIALMQLSVELLSDCGFTEKEALEALFPLALANISNVGIKGIQGSLTGPVERFDADTVKGHISCLARENKELYILLTKRLLDIAIKKHPDKVHEFAVLQNILEEVQ